MSKKYLLSILIVPLIFLLLSCSVKETRSQTETLSLVGTYWTLKSLGETNNMTPAIPGRTITIEFTTTAYGGDVSNNSHYGASYKTDGNNITMNTITFAGFTITDDPPGFLKQYQTYIRLLPLADNFKITDDELLINCSDGNSLLFSRIAHPTR